MQPRTPVEAPLPPEERTYEGVSREKGGAWVADIKFDKEEIKRLGTFATAGAAGWAYDAAREERGLPPVNFPARARRQLRLLRRRRRPRMLRRCRRSPLRLTMKGSRLISRSRSRPRAGTHRGRTTAGTAGTGAKPHVASAASAWAGVCTDLLAALEDQSGIVGIRDRLVSDRLRCR